MRSRRAPQPRPAHDVCGFTIVEVVVAMALLAIVIVPICGSLLALTARAGALARVSGASSLLETAEDPWRWSDLEVDDARWQGTTLRGDVRAALAPDLVEIGWWVDGWLCGTVAGDQTGSFTIDPPLGGWPASAQWVTVRLRTDSGAWGSPWRTALSSNTAASAASAALSPTQPLVGEVQVEPSAVIVVHNPGAGNADVRLGYPDAPRLTLAPEGATAVPLAPGILNLYCDGSLQTLQLENGDVVHLFF
ncbi:MAG: PulJ/GspJ family protein [Thermoleophilia bacterium]